MAGHQEKAAGIAEEKSGTKVDKVVLYGKLFF